MPWLQVRASRHQGGYKVYPLIRPRRIRGSIFLQRPRIPGVAGRHHRPPPRRQRCTQQRTMSHRPRRRHRQLYASACHPSRPQHHMPPRPVRRQQRRHAAAGAPPPTRRAHAAGRSCIQLPPSLHPSPTCPNPAQGGHPPHSRKPARCHVCQPSAADGPIRYIISGHATARGRLPALYPRQTGIHRGISLPPRTRCQQVWRDNQPALDGMLQSMQAAGLQVRIGVHDVLSITQRAGDGAPPCLSCTRPCRCVVGDGRQSLLVDVCAHDRHPALARAGRAACAGWR